VRHPNWTMGAKIRVDRATMLNQGLELMEAHHLLPVGVDRIAIMAHAKSVSHYLVQERDHSTVAQLRAPDMRIPIADAPAWTERVATSCAPLDLVSIGRLDFEAPDEERFPAIRIAREAIIEGGTCPAILNAANEVAVEAFLKEKISFLEIA